MKKSVDKNDEKKAGAGSGKKVVKAATSGVKPSGKAADLELTRERIRNLVGQQAQNMVETTIAEVGKGHYLAMKYLFEMIGLYPGVAQEESPVDDSLARTLLRRLGLPDDPMFELPVTKDCEADKPVAKEDTVK